MTPKVPPFTSYSFHPEYVTEAAGEIVRHFASITALAKDGTIWRNHQKADETWAGWRQIY
jgi:hypothetical protein